MPTLKGKTMFITGASRGIGKAIALVAARDGANVAIAAKTTEPHPKLSGTIFTAAEEIERAGGKALPLAVDIRNDEQTAAAVEKTVQTFGGIDLLVNNASAIFLAPTTATPMKRYDLMHQVNVRGTFLCSQLCIPHLKKAANPHILNLASPLSMQAKWFSGHLAYTMSKFGMSMCVLGMAAELAGDGIAVNALWPRTVIWTAAVENLLDPNARPYCRKPEIMGDAAHFILTSDSRSCTGNFFVDDDVLRRHGVTDLDQYAMQPGHELQPDFFLE
ncbi:MAG: NAD(P)-dependent oxidoreductase [Planctomycetia bacterium]|nr:NAD(P)-dependent oxidoreductase [Planctomycetia bacterium]